jgi:hypothetical protein
VDGDEAEQAVLGDPSPDAAIMRAKLTFDVVGCEELPNQSRDALKQIAAAYAKRVLEEAGRLEAAANQGLNEPMITPTHLTDADTWLRRGYITSPAPQGKSTKAKIYTALSYAIAIICGFFINNITEPWGAIGVVVFVLLGFLFFVLGEGLK